MAGADIRNEKFTGEVRRHCVGKVPVILTIGRQEVENRTHTLRQLGKKQRRVVELDSVVADLATDAIPPVLR